MLCLSSEIASTFCCAPMKKKVPKIKANTARTVSMRLFSSKSSASDLNSTQKLHAVSVGAESCDKFTAFFLAFFFFVAMNQFLWFPVRDQRFGFCASRLSICLEGVNSIWSRLAFLYLCLALINWFIDIYIEKLIKQKGRRTARLV